MKSRSLVERLRSYKDIVGKSLRKTLYAPLALAAALSFSSPAQAQTSVNETFTNNVAERAYVEEHDAKWAIANERIEALDFDASRGDTETAGFTRRITEDRLYDFAAESLCFEAKTSVENWEGSQEALILILASGAVVDNNGEFFMFRGNWNPQTSGVKYWITHETPGQNTTYANGLLDTIPLGGVKTMKVCRTGKDYVFSLKYLIGVEETERVVARLDNLPDLVSYIGVGRYDSVTSPNTSPNTLAYFDDLTTTSNLGGGAVQIQKVKMGGGGGLEAHIPDKFIRGDSNMDGSLDISDGINTLNYLFLGGGNKQCPDAMDINDSGDVDLSDAIKTFGILFLGDPYKIPAPSYLKDGNSPDGLKWGLADIDLTKDPLSCRGYQD